MILKALQYSIQRFGMIKSLIINSSNVITAGHQRKKATVAIVSCIAQTFKYGRLTVSKKSKKLNLFDKCVESGEVENNLAIIQSLSMQGKSMEEIAKVFGVTRRTLQNLQNKHPSLRKAIETGWLSVVAMCQNKLMELVTNSDTIAIIYALKVYSGEFFNDRKVVEAKITSPVSVQPQVQIYLPVIDAEDYASDEQKAKAKNVSSIIIIRPQQGKQELFLRSPADICIYGGAVGERKNH